MHDATIENKIPLKEHWFIIIPGKVIQMFRFVSILLINCIWSIQITAGTLTERDAIEQALQSNSNIKITRINQINDSLQYEQQSTNRLPQLSLSLSPSITPNEESANTYQGVINGHMMSLTKDTSIRSADVKVSIDITQDLPMGASFTTGFNQSVTSRIPSDTTLWGSIVSFSATQQLLRGAFKYDSVSYFLKISRLENECITLAYKKNIIGELSNIRTQYWNHYLCKTLEKIANEQLLFAMKQREVALERFSIGQVAEIDTLSAALEELRLRNSLISANYATIESKEKLATSIQKPVDSVNIPDSLNIEITDLPETDELIKLARSYDPEIQLLAILREKLTTQLAQTRNNLLPSLAVNASYTINRNGDGFFSSNQLKHDNLVLSMIFTYQLPYRSNAIEVSKAKLQIDNNEIKAQQKEMNLYNSLELFQKNWKREMAKIDLAHSAVIVSKKQLVAAQQGYELGSVDRLELLKAQNDVSKTQTEYVQGLIEMKLLEISIEEMTGIVLDRFGVQF